MHIKDNRLVLDITSSPWFKKYWRGVRKARESFINVQRAVVLQQFKGATHVSVDLQTLEILGIIFPNEEDTIIPVGLKLMRGRSQIHSAILKAGLQDLSKHIVATPNLSCIKGREYADYLKSFEINHAKAIWKFLGLPTKVQVKKVPDVGSMVGNNFNLAPITTRPINHDHYRYGCCTKTTDYSMNQQTIGSSKVLTISIANQNIVNVDLTDASKFKLGKNVVALDETDMIRLRTEDRRMKESARHESRMAQEL
ncbi:hypothetical protein GR7B_00020 [Vibrio phage vB_VcorM_GR7B]|nr:hypothetical protein GR7B_00020 [Vibrio phage vB_VcorM_GR7B]